MGIQDQLQAALEPALSAQSLIIEDVDVAAAGKRRIVRITVDREIPPAETASDAVIEPLSLDEIAEATRTVDEVLERDNLMGAQPYVLEVSSPGTDRLLTVPRHFRRNLGRLIAVTTDAGEKHTGRLTALAADTITLVVPPAAKKPEYTLDLPLAEVSSARVQIEFNRKEQQ